MSNERKRKPEMALDDLGPPGSGDDPAKKGSAWEHIPAAPLVPDGPVEAMPPRAAKLETQDGKEMRKLFAHLIEDV
jgi:hypothetical protein